MTNLATVLFVIASILAIWSLAASHTSPRVAALNSRAGGRTLYDQTCLEHGTDPLADYDIEGTP